MSNIQKTDSAPTLKAFFAQDTIAKKFKEIVGKNAPSLITSALQVCGSNTMLKNATPASVYGAVMTAATMNLPINNNLGFAYIVPFRNRKAGTTEAQFQIGYKGLIQLAKRSGQCKTIATTAIYEGQLLVNNPLTGCEFDFENKESDKIIGYAAYYEEVNGFSKTVFKTTAQIVAHASRYSQTFKNGYGVWKDNFDEMAQKTILKGLLSKYATMSIELLDAVERDQTVVSDDDVSYPDAIEVQVDESSDSTPSNDMDEALGLKEDEETEAGVNPPENYDGLFGDENKKKKKRSRKSR